MDEKKVREAIKEFEIEVQVFEDMISYCKHFESKNDCGRYEEKIAMCKTATEALEKQLPKKVKNVSDAYSYTIGEYRIGKCPNCENEVSDVINVCLKCRQNLDWSE